MKNEKIKMKNQDGSGSWELSVGCFLCWVTNFI